MGDDTNDIQVASEARIACIVNPCSEAMKEWIELKSTSSDSSHSEVFIHHDYNHSSNNLEETIEIAPNLYISHLSNRGHESTECLLRKILQLLMNKTFT
jgi:hypothetical protein